MQILKLVVLMSTLSLVIETANAAPTTDLPQAPASDSQIKTEATGNRSVSANNAADSATEADKTTPVAAAAAKDKPAGAAMSAESDVEDINSLIVQDRLATIVEDDFTFEQARRRLANEVELEKMRSELRKLRGEDKVVRSQPVQAQPSETAAKAQPKAAIDMPRVILEAEIGGSRRIAVTDGKTLRYVRTGEIFSIGENKFKLASDKKTVTLVEGAAQ